jgi:deoxyadenosine/deoxycytidine kinase
MKDFGLYVGIDGTVNEPINFDTYEDAYNKMTEVLGSDLEKIDDTFFKCIVDGKNMHGRIFRRNPYYEIWKVSAITGKKYKRELINRLNLVGKCADKNKAWAKVVMEEYWKVYCAGHKNTHKVKFVLYECKSH